MIIKNAKIYGEQKLDLKIEDGKITQIANDLNDDEHIVDIEGKTLLPSFIDLNVSLLDNEFSIDKLYNLEKACLKGGVGTIVLKDSLEANTQGYALYYDKLKSLDINVLPTINVLDKTGKLKNIATLIDMGAKGLELTSTLGANYLRQCMQYASMKSSPIFLKCFDESFDDHGVMNDSKMSFELGLIGISDIAETSEVAKMKELVEFYGNNACFGALGVIKSFELLENYQSEISIHHLIKDENSCENFNTYAKILPPLRSKNELSYLIKMLQKGKITFLTSLHTPSTKKDLAFDEADFGVNAIAMYMSLCFTYLIKENVLTWKELCDFTSYNQAQFLGLNKGKVESGFDADLVVFDENYSFNGEGLYINDILQGKVEKSFIAGKVFSI
ncbi:dihydroorotase, subgroup IIa [Campylobacter lari]|uniref:Dihydroorotase, subgroup IIa n=1 Tax=Campylobacter lari NCTC 11845 TaxID=1388749 RepID=A0A0A8HWM8_CAMLA|nr:dihydroorotase, subgroup IIa [Campylobacter lari]AJD02264.1 dihydroorotase, subgroup IIa [Campylobacter lari NCTC 11845]EAK0979715.1 dihydroorotase, subgroup IIa [Campylobacter lari]EAK9954139.1 dihydroorotase, subgroup IIa [Campylobacter lari]